MVRMRRRPGRAIGCAACGVTMLLTGAASAGDVEAPAPDGVEGRLDHLFEQELDRLFDHLQGVLEDLPRYALPEVTEDGDIIIRRLPRRPEELPRGQENPDRIVEL